MNRSSSKAKFTRIIRNLCNGFELLEKHNNLKRLNEATARSEYIDPFFEALGWDIYNKKQDPPNTKEVLREENPSEVHQKRPDYTFRIGGIPHFTVEAKKPKEDLSKNKKHIFQAKKYAYSASLPIAILTDFEEFKVYDCTLKPQFEAPNRGLIMELDLKYPDYLKKINLLYSIFSFNAVANASLMRLLSKLKKDSKIHTIENFLFKLKGVEPVSEAFLEDLSIWRDNIARDIVSHNQLITEEFLNESTQRLLDRLIFIRVCEDRGIEPKEILKEAANSCSKESGNLMDYLVPLFSELNVKYNGLIFKEHELEKLKISNKTLNDIILNLYTPNCPYQFDVIDVRIIGHAYERFLAKKLCLLPGQKIDIVESREFRKEEGIFYTSSSIVEYIVNNTLGEKLRNITFEDVAKLKILDPACGSGSFLLAAFQLLIDYYEDYYTKYPDKGNRNDFFTLPNGEIVLTPQKKAQIVLDNLFGVDKDPQAVEFTCMSIYLRILEGDYSEYLFKHFYLPLLDNNFKCGNSLIDFDIFDDIKMSDLFRDVKKDITAKYSPFNWENSFREIFEAGGFDIIITNPPYGAKFDKTERNYFEKYYPDLSSMKNSALLFMNKACDLLRPRGLTGFIVPKSLAFSEKWKIGRNLVKDYLTKIADVGKAWKEVKLEQLIYIIESDLGSVGYTVESIVKQKGKKQPSVFVSKPLSDKADIFILEPEPKFIRVFKKLNVSGLYLKGFSKTRRGLPWQQYLSKASSKFKVFRGSHIQKYRLLDSNEYFPNSFMKSYEKKRYVEALRNPKIISQRIVAHRENQTPKLKIMSTLDLDGVLTVDTVENTVLTSPRYSLFFVLSLLNSNLIAWYAYYFIFASAIRSMDLDDYYIGKIPLPDYRLIDKQLFKRAVLRLLFLYNDIMLTKSDSEKRRLTQEITFLENKINRTIYHYYKLSKEEVSIIETTM